MVHISAVCLVGLTDRNLDERRLPSAGASRTASASPARPALAALSVIITAWFPLHPHPFRPSLIFITNDQPYPYFRLPIKCVWWQFVLGNSFSDFSQLKLDYNSTLFRNLLAPCRGVSCCSHCEYVPHLLNFWLRYCAHGNNGRSGYLL